jgi:hypothetical protein
VSAHAHRNVCSVAGHDLKGLRAYFNCQISQLNFPLFAIVDYSGMHVLLYHTHSCIRAGYRMSCMSLLPISKGVCFTSSNALTRIADTLIYGSSDGAKTVKADRSIGACDAVLLVWSRVITRVCRD